MLSQCDGGFRYTVLKKFVLFLFLFTYGWTQDPNAIYLTWKGDPSTTMTIMWLTTTGDQSSQTVYYQHPHEDDWTRQKGVANPLKQSNITIHYAEIENLEPDTEYFFRVNDGEIHRFRTLPLDLSSRPMKVAIGGDAYFSKELFHKMNLEVASQEPDFVILAGDIVYAEGLRCALRPYSWKVNRWETFFEIWSKDMVTKDGRLIPIVPVIGNHDVKEGFDNPHKIEVFFYEFFVFPVKGVPFQTLEFGSDLCFYLLDSGHTYPIGGMQTEWLKRKLKQNQHTSYNIPVYHIGAYPSETSYTHRGSKDIRKFWVPLFEQYGVKIAMEHDNHTFKKTYPIWKGTIDPKGIYYLGDGSWGVPPLKPRKHWYLEKAQQTNCYWLLELEKDQCRAIAYENDGHLLDEMTIFPN